MNLEQFEFISARLQHIENRLGDVLHQNSTTHERLNILMAQIDDLNAALATIDTDLTALQSENSTILSDLEAALASGTAPDLSAAIAHLKTIDTAITAITASDVSATTPATPATPVTVTPTPAS